tara:strand:- start:806 stop:1546 length:741 start_codon:yes stop_codon:yes gene_type:complete
MEWQQIADYLTSNQLNYGAVVAIGLGGAFLGSVMGISSRKNKERESERAHRRALDDSELTRVTLSTLEKVTELGLAAEANRVEVLKLKNEENHREYDRSLTLESTKRERKEQADERKKERIAQKETLKGERKLLDKAAKLELVRETAEIVRGQLEAYRDDLLAYQGERKKAIEAADLKNREEYRSELAEEFREEMKEKTGFYSNNANVNQQDLTNIDNLVNMKYPLTEIEKPKVPRSIKRLTKLLQ